MFSFSKSKSTRTLDAQEPKEVVKASEDDDPEVAGLPQYNTFNDLAPEYQLTPEHDENHIFPQELELVEQVRKIIPEIEEWPTRYVLIFLFARRHSVPHTIQLIRKHLGWLKEWDCQPITKTNLYPFRPEQLPELEMKYCLFGGFTLYKHVLVDNNNRLLRYQIMRYFFPSEHSLKDYMLTTLWWYYYTFQFVPLSVHRNGHAVVVDMEGMGWSNLSFASETQKTLIRSVGGLPGRMRICWTVNSNWALHSAMAVCKLILSKKIMDRIQLVSVKALKDVIPADNIPKSLGGNWVPNMEVEWYQKNLELDKEAAKHENGEKTEKSEKVEKAEKADKADKSESSEDGGEKLSKSKKDKEKSEKRNKEEHSQKPEKTPRGEKPEKTPRGEKPEKTPRGERPEKTPRGEKTPGNSEKGAKSSQKSD